MNTQAAPAKGPNFLNGRIALVTGSTSEIGSETADALADAGVDLVINGLGDPGAIDATCTKLGKNGVLGLTQTVGLESAKFGVTRNAICPGYVWTPMVENQIADTAQARGIAHEAVILGVLLAAQSTKLFTTVEELGAHPVFLCGFGSASIASAALPVDGDWPTQ